MQYVIDTHALIWFFEDDARLSSAVKAVLLDPASQLILPVIALAEAIWIIDRIRPNLADRAQAVTKLRQTNPSKLQTKLSF